MYLRPSMVNSLRPNIVEFLYFRVSCRCWNHRNIGSTGLHRPLQRNVVQLEMTFPRKPTRLVEIILSQLALIYHSSLISHSSPVSTSSFNKAFGMKPWTFGSIDCIPESVSFVLSPLGGNAQRLGL